MPKNRSTLSLEGVRSLIKARETLARHLTAALPLELTIEQLRELNRDPARLQSARDRMLVEIMNGADVEWDQSCRFPTWRTVKVGTHGRSVTRLVSAMSATEVDAEAGRFMREDWFNWSFARSVREIHLVRVSLGDLGCEPSATLFETLRKVAREAGLKECNREVALQLRRVHIDQPAGEMLAVVTQFFPTYDANGFLVWREPRRSGGQKWLSLLRGNRTGEGNCLPYGATYEDIKYIFRAP
jgi:hypothetical protein